MIHADECREEYHLLNIPDDQVIAFGCECETEGIAAGRKPIPCEKWCHSANCPVSLKSQ